MKVLSIITILGVIISTSYANIVPNDNAQVAEVRILGLLDCARAVAESAVIITNDVLPELPKLASCSNIVLPKELRPNNRNIPSISNVLKYLRRILVEFPQCISSSFARIIDNLEILDAKIQKCNNI